MASKRPTDINVSAHNKQDSIQDVSKGINLNGTLSPGLSDVSTSSVNERQRKLSETVLDWVFDESDSCPVSEISESSSSTAEDGEYQKPNQQNFNY